MSSDLSLSNSSDPLLIGCGWRACARHPRERTQRRVDCGRILEFRSCSRGTTSGLRSSAHPAPTPAIVVRDQTGALYAGSC